MGLFGHIRREEKPVILDAAEAKARLYQGLAEYTGWAFLKSGPSLKKQIGDVVLDIVFYSSKYNNLQHVVDVNGEFRIWVRALDRTCNANSKIGSLNIRPENGGWYDLSTQDALNRALHDMQEKIKRYVFPAADAFEESQAKGLAYLGEQAIYRASAFAAYQRMFEQNS